MGKVKALELERMFQREEFARLTVENNALLDKGVINSLEYEIKKAKILFDFENIMNKINSEENMSYMGNEDFPNASDITSVYVNSVEEKKLPALLTHLRITLDRVLAPQSSKERMHSMHVERLIQITRARISSISTINQAKNAKENKGRDNVGG